MPKRTGAGSTGDDLSGQARTVSKGSAGTLAGAPGLKQPAGTCQESAPAALRNGGERRDLGEPGGFLRRHRQSQFHQLCDGTCSYW